MSLNNPRTRTHIHVCVYVYRQRGINMSKCTYMHVCVNVTHFKTKSDYTVNMVWCMRSIPLRTKQTHSAASIQVNKTNKQ